MRAGTPQPVKVARDAAQRYNRRPAAAGDGGSAAGSGEGVLESLSAAAALHDHRWGGELE